MINLIKQSIYIYIYIYPLTPIPNRGSYIRHRAARARAAFLISTRALPNVMLTNAMLTHVFYWVYRVIRQPPREAGMLSRHTFGHEKKRLENVTPKNAKKRQNVVQASEKASKKVPKRSPVDAKSVKSCEKCDLTKTSLKLRFS